MNSDDEFLLPTTRARRPPEEQLSAKRSAKLLKIGRQPKLPGKSLGKIKVRLIETAWNAADSNIAPLPSKQTINAKTGKIEPAEIAD